MFRRFRTPKAERLIDYEFCRPPDICRHCEDKGYHKTLQIPALSEALESPKTDEEEFDEIDERFTRAILASQNTDLVTRLLADCETARHTIKKIGLDMDNEMHILLGIELIESRVRRYKK